MQVNPKREQKGEQILRLLTQFYCSLTGKKEMQNISVQIRQFVMIRTDIKNKQQTAKRILDFFLRMQSKLISKSDRNWDQAFQIATARGQALLKICNFPVHNILIYAINRLKSLNRPSRRECDTIVFDIQPQSQELEIQIQKDVKTKTYFFFKWCQYVEHSKELKKMKQREVENQKISLSFNKYGTKSNYFNAWKIIYKKNKVEKERVKRIQTHTKQNILRDCLTMISETAAIISLESILAKKVRQKILQIKKKDTLKKMKINQSYIKNRAKYQKYTNQYAFMFVKHFSSKIKPLMNKSFQNSRIKFQEDSKLNFIRKFFSQYKNIYCESKQKFKKVLNYQKSNFLKSWKNMSEQSIGFMDKSQKFQNFLTIRRKRIVITVLSFNKLLKQQQFKQIQVLIQNNGCSINNRSLMQVNMKKQIQNKKSFLTKYFSQKLKKRFISSIINNLNSKNDSLKNEVKIKQLLALKFRRRYNSYVSKVGLRTEFYDKIQRKHERVIKLSSFKNLRKLKYVRRLEESSVDVINKYSKRLILMNFWGRLKLRAFEKNCIQRLVNSAQTVIFRLAYYKLATKSIFINQNVKRIQHNGEKKIIKNLFNLLLRNSKYNTQRSTLIEKVNMKRCQTLLLNKLKQIHVLRQKCSIVKSALDKNKIKLLFSCLNAQYQVNKDELSKSQKVGKKIFLVYLRKTLRAGNVINDQLNRKSEILAQNIRESEINRFFDSIKSSNKQREIFAEKQRKLIFKIARRRILQVKQYIQCSKVQKTYFTNKNVLLAKRRESALKILVMKQKALFTQSQVNYSRKVNGFDDFRKIALFSIKSRNNVQQIRNSKFIHDSTDFFKLLIAQKKKAQAKIQEIQEMQENSLTKRMKLFFSLLKNNKQNIKSQSHLFRVRKHSLFSEFVATNLKCKFSRIKFNCSLKTYARNIMKKAFKSLKQAHVKQKQKQNMIRFDKTSSILMQKSIQKSFKSNTLSEQIQRFNLRKSRHQMR